FHGSGNLDYNYITYNNAGVTNYYYYPLNIYYRNHAIEGYLQNRFTFGGLTFTPGVRMDYLKRTNTATTDPRGTVSYEFKTGTTLSAGGGMYSSFVQTNPNDIMNNDPRYAQAHYAKPERATHAAASIEQVYELFTFSLECFDNYFYNLFETFPYYGQNGSYRIGINKGRMHAYGSEVMIRKKPSINRNSWFGWISYAYTQSKDRSGLLLPTVIQDRSTFNQETAFWQLAANTSVYDPGGNRWTNAQYERVHSFKTVLGYIFGNHTISTQFQIFTSFPYTDIWGSSTLTLPTFTSGSGGFSGFTNNTFSIPVYNTHKNSRHYPSNSRLDLKYSYKQTYEWGYVNWFIGIIDCYAPFYHPTTGYQSFNPFLPYIPGVNPQPYSSRTSEGNWKVLGNIVPNIGVEVRF
ncbi:MAG: hypothetical protein ACHP6H_05890, partial [Legionellales bacterium]